MRRVLILAEGQTEERFIKDVLEPHLATFNVFVRASIVRTKEPPAGSPYKGGFFSYHKIRKDVFRLLDDTNAVVTSMFDLYGLPSDFPGLSASQPMVSKHDKAASIQRAFDFDINHPRFRSFITLHEFETLVFACPKSLGNQFSNPNLSEWCRQITQAAGGTELINDGPDTHPHARLSAKIDGYRKVAHGPLIVSKEGLASVRALCPHFNGWLMQLENLALNS